MQALQGAAHVKNFFLAPDYYILPPDKYLKLFQAPSLFPATLISGSVQRRGSPKEQTAAGKHQFYRMVGLNQALFAGGFGQKLSFICLFLIYSHPAVNAQPECHITGGSEEICYGTSTSWNGPEGMSSYYWTGPEGFNSVASEISVTVAGTYTLTITDPTGVSTCTRTLTVLPRLMPGSINTTLREFCTGGTTVIGGTNPPYGPATGGSGLYFYTWQLQPGCTGEWADIPGTNLTSYAPEPPPSTTCYRRKVEDPVCNSIAVTAFKRFEIYEDPVSQSVVPLPADQVICAGIPVSATFKGGSGGYPGGTTDIYEYSTNYGSAWNDYQPGQLIPTSGLSGTGVVGIRTRRISTGVNGCNFGLRESFSWSVNPSPETSSIYHQ